jgi:hypothetical protein
MCSEQECSAMKTFVLTCPKTSQPLTVEIATDFPSMRLAWDTTLHIKCAHCGRVHQMAFRDAYVAATLNGSDDVPRGVVVDDGDATMQSRATRTHSLGI